MSRVLIPLTVLFSITVCTLSLSQIPTNISTPFLVKPEPLPPGFSPDAACNNAGTFQLGAFTGQSNDFSLDTIFLCFGDQICLEHDGNFDISGDPQPSSLGGVTYAFYDCMPTVSGMTLANIVGDPCLNQGGNPGPQQGIWVSQMNTLAEAQGDQCFLNNGNLQAFFSTVTPPPPLLQWFAPITVDNWAANGYEQTGPGQPIGPCVSVNVAEKFAVVYLNPIVIDNIQTTVDGSNCIGNFRAKGGLSEFDSSLYTLNISGPGQVLVATKPVDIWHKGQNPRLMFSTPGVYTINVEDGKSCGATFTMDMSGCTPTDNVVVSTPDVLVQPGEIVCFPVTVSNFTDIETIAATIQWDSSLFTYVSYQNPYWVDIVFTEDFTTGGLLSFSWLDNQFDGETIPDGSILFEICLQATGPTGSGSGINLTSDLTPILAEDPNGFKVAVNYNPGSIIIGGPMPLMASVNITSNCTSAGAFEVTASGGTPSYTIQYQNITFMSQVVSGTFSSTFSATNLPGSEYGITVTDAAGSTWDTTIVIYSMVANFAKVDPNCFGNCNGVAGVEIQVNGTTIQNPGPEFTFNWNDIGPGASSRIGLCAGSYSITVTNTTNGCTAITSGGLSTNSPIVISNIQTTDASCSGIANGGLSFTVLNGTPTYTISVAGGNPPFSDLITGSSYSSSAMVSGNYILTATDSKACSATASVTIFALKEYDLDSIVTDVTCFGGSNGSISVILTTNPGQPTPPVVFSWSSGTPVNAGFSSSVSNLGVGPVQLTVADVTGCGVSATFNIGSPAKLVATPNAKNPTCAFGNDGSINFFPPGGLTGGTLPYSFNWSNGAMTPALNNLLPGTYSATISDAQGCADTISVELNTPQPPIITSIDSTSLSCANSTNGVLKVNAIPGQIGCNITNYKWSNGGLTNTISGLDCGIYTVSVSDDCGCQATATIDLWCPPAIAIIDTTIISPTCPGDNNGSISIVVNGGFPPYSYKWNIVPSPNLPGIGSRPKGNYAVTVTDSKMCTLVALFEIKDPIGIQATISGLQNASCGGGGICDGAASVAATLASNPTASFTYYWQEAMFFGQNPTTLCAGSNTVVITDNATTCKISVPVMIGAPPALVLNANDPIPTSCAGVCDGSASASASGGTMPYTFSWSTGQTGSPISGLCAGQLAVTLTDANGCEVAEPLSNVVEPPAVQVFFDASASQDVLCNGGSNGILGWIVSGGTAPFSWTWSPNVGNSQVISNLAAGTYAVTATDLKGCTGTATATLQEKSPLVYAISPWAPIQCFGENTSLFIDTMFAGAGAPYLYELDDAGGIPFDIPTSIEGGDHQIVFVHGPGGECRDTVDIQVNQPAEIQLDLGADLTIELGDTSRQIFPQYNIQIDSFLWSPTAGLSLPTDLNPLVTTFESTLYTLTIFDANGCSTTDEIQISIDPNRKVFIPNIFKPGTSLSDHFRVFVGNGVELINYMQVYDRWGGLMYELRDFFPSNGDYSEGWDGTVRGKSMNPGVYVYLVEVKFLDGRVLLYRGDVTLMR